MKTFTIARALPVTSIAACMLASAQIAAAADQLTVVSWGGATQLSHRKASFEPYAKTTGAKLTEDEWNGDAAKVRAMVVTKSVSWDVIDASGRGALQMCAEGLIEKIDWKKLGLDRSRFQYNEKHDCGVTTLASSNVIAWDKDKLANGPKSMRDLFDTQKFPGKRGLWKGPAGNLEWALIADGVPAKEVYKVLATPAGVDRAFGKLDTIKKDVVWWTSGAQPMQLLADGQVVMTMAWNGRVYDAVRNSGKHFEILWDNQQMSYNVWVIPKGTPHRDEAYRFIAYAASAPVQANQTRYIPYAPGNKDAMALVDPAMLSSLPTAPQNFASAQMIDIAFWSEHNDELSQRFTAWLAK